jgi:hypothetical protein
MKYANYRFRQFEQKHTWRIFSISPNILKSI